MSDVITVADLEETKKHNTFHVDVITGRTGDYATNEVTGQVQKTLPATINDIDWSYVGKFADGVTFTKSTDFALDASNTQWIYVGASPFPVVVPAGTIPSAPDYQVVHVNNHSILTGRNDAGAHPAAAITDDTKAQTVQETLDGFQQDLNALELDVSPPVNYLTGARTSEQTSLTIIGDSITQGIFSGSGLSNSNFYQSYLYRVCRSVFNHNNRGFGNDTGRMYETNANMFYGAWFEVGMPGNGGGVSSAAVTFPNTGLVEKQLSIPSGEWIEIKLREISKVGFFYDGSQVAHTASSADVALNGVSVGALTTTGTAAASHTGYITLAEESVVGDTIRITAVGGTLIISGFTLYKTSTVGVRVNAIGWSGRTFDDFNTPAKIAEISALSNFEVSFSQRKLVAIALGTNSIYQAGRSQTPAEYIASLQSLMTEIQALSVNTTFLLTVPPRANPALHPVQEVGFAYDDYVKAIVDFADANGYSLIRYDRSALSQPPYVYYSDGLHPSANGHEIMAKIFCDAIGVPYDNYVKTIDARPSILTRTLEYPIDSFPGSGGAPTIKWQDVPIAMDRIKSVRIRSSGGVEYPAEVFWDLANSCGMFWQRVTSTSTRVFYPNTNGFIRTTGYHIAAGLVTAGKPTGYTLIIDYL